MRFFKNSHRKVKDQVLGRFARDGAGVRLVRVLSKMTSWDYDPFLLLDVFDSTDPDDYIKGFPMHPHRGLETVTYLMEGSLEHEDSLGNKGTIVSGGCQWMTAGKGVIHQEMPVASPRLFGMQLWVNLPKRNKMDEPKYQAVTPDQIPLVKEEGAELRIISGNYKGKAGAVQPDYVKVTFMDLTLDAGGTWSMDTPHDDTVFVYVLEGGCFDAGLNAVPGRQGTLFSEGNSVTLKGGPEKSRIAVFMGKPLREPIAWGGPFVMNAEEELDQVLEELETGTFIKK